MLQNKARMLVLPVPNLSALKFMRFRDSLNQIAIKADLQYLNVNKKKKANEEKFYWFSPSLFQECLKYFLLDGEAKSQDGIFEQLQAKKDQLCREVYEVCLRCEYLILVAEANKVEEGSPKEQYDVQIKFDFAKIIQHIFDVNVQYVDRVKALNYLDWVIQKNQFFDYRIKAKNLSLSQIQFNTLKQRIIDNVKCIEIFLSKWLTKSQIIIL